MTQSRGMSLIEAVTNVVVGYAAGRHDADRGVPVVRSSPKPRREPDAGRGIHRHIAPAKLRTAQTVRSRAKAIACVSCAGRSRPQGLRLER